MKVGRFTRSPRQSTADLLLRRSLAFQDSGLRQLLTVAADQCSHTANSLQKFGMTRTPAPPWVAVHRLHVPHHCLAQAADNLVTAFGGPEMAYKIAGGVKWWQVRAGPGVEAEWICMKKDYRQFVNEEKKWAKKQRQEEAEDTGCELVLGTVS